MWAILLLTAACAADSITFKATTTVPEGGTPELLFGSRVHGQLKVDLSCDGKRFGLQTAVVPDGSYPLQLKGLAPGQHDCSGSVRLDEPDGAWGEMPLRVQVALLPPLGFELVEDGLDLEAGTLKVRPSRRLSKASVDRIGVGGVDLGGASVDLSDPGLIDASWSPGGEEVLKLRVEGTDEAGMAGFLELSPWSYEVPHDDVVFASGSHDLDASEVPKLEGCWDDVQAVLAKYGDVVEIQLFVAGFTDTVGAAGSNEALSQRRAQTIARWFRDRGFTGGVHYQGFGERVLAVGTPDETDGAANRRAVYILAADVPPVSEGLPAQRWTRVP